MRCLIITFLVAILSACAVEGGKELDYHQPDDIKEGPGLFTGKEGKYTIFVPYPD